MSRHAADGPVDGGPMDGGPVDGGPSAPVASGSAPVGRTGGTADDPQTAPGMRVVAGTPSPEELAAVTAVLRAAAVEAERAGRARVDAEPRSAWDVSARGLRQPLERGAWNRSRP